MTGSMTCTEAVKVARRWAERGIPAFPIAVSWDPAKKRTNKRPLTDNGHLDGTVDFAELDHLFNARSPRPGEAWGVGLHLGPAGYAAVDIDVGDKNGDDTWADLVDQHGDFITYVSLTASGGFHIIGHKGSRHVGNAHTLGEGIDVRGDNGWIVAPGTQTPWGTWQREESAKPWPPAPFPAWVLERISATNGHTPAARGRWQPLDRSTLHPADLAALEALEAHGGHDPYIGGDGALMVVRPGKTAGGSASIGHIGPGVVKMFTSSWPPFEQDRVYEADQLIDDHDTATPYAPKWAALIVDGKSWLTGGPDRPQPLWGVDTAMLAALDQPTTIAGPQGAGKSVFGQRLALGWLGVVDKVLGLPVHAGDGNVLYLASDRPDQARLSMRRMVTDDELDTLEARMRVWKGPPPEDVAKQPLMLLEMAEVADARLLVIDSVKDVALKLSSDEVGAAYNTALQHAVAAGIQIVALHHPRKLGGESRGDVPVRTIDDLYGATWITAGNGSVVYLQPGALDGYTLTQLKSPIGEKTDIDYEHVTETGDLRRATTPTLVTVLEQAGDEGISAVHAACCVYRVDKPEEYQRKKIARALNELVEEGVAEIIKGGRVKRWRAAA